MQRLNLMEADKQLGHPILRQSFDIHELDEPGDASKIRSFIESDSKSLPREVVAVLKKAQVLPEVAAMPEEAQTPPGN